MSDDFDAEMKAFQVAYEHLSQLSPQAAKRALFYLCDRLMPRKSSAHSKGGIARAAILTPERRTEIAVAAANARWKKR